MNNRFLLAGAAAFLATAGFANAQTVAPAAPADVAAPAAEAPPASPELAAPPADAAPAAPPADAAVASAGDGVTKEGGKYLKDGRKATKEEIASYKKSGKSKPMS